MSLKRSSLSVIVLTVMSSILVVRADDSGCPDGWFGSRCHFKCHCKNDTSCDRYSGECPDGACAPGWFDMGCQYVDWVLYSIAPLWLRDGDESTCNPQTNMDKLTITFDDEQLINRYMLIGVGSAADKLSLVSVARQSKGAPEEIVSDHFRQLNGYRVEYFVDTPRKVQLYTFQGAGVGLLCSLYMTSGRNVALKQTTSLSRQLVANPPLGPTYPIGLSDSTYAVDGNTGQNHIKFGCAHSHYRSQNNETWTIEFDHPVVIYRMIVYSLDDWSACNYHVPGFQLVHSNDLCKYNITKLNAYVFARLWCESTLKGHLASFTTQDCWDTLKDLIIPLTGCVIGVTDRHKEGRWITDGENEVKFSPWARGQPNSGSGNEDCVYATRQYWEDIPCEFKLPACCVTTSRRTMRALYVRGYNESADEVFVYQAPNIDLAQYNIYNVTPIITRMELETEQNRELQICEFEAYGEIICPEGTFGLECISTCFCVKGPCSPTGWCESGCAEGYDESNCTGCPEGFFGFPVCQSVCSVNCFGICDHHDGTCTQGCIAGYWGKMCDRNCSVDCPGTCDSRTGDCPQDPQDTTTERPQQEKTTTSFSILIIVLISLPLLCLLLWYVKRVTEILRTRTTASTGLGQQPGTALQPEDMYMESAISSRSKSVATGTSEMKTKSIRSGETEI